MTHPQTGSVHQSTTQTWRRLPDGIKVRLRENNREGVICGLGEQ
jgi:hypothetical protein